MAALVPETSASQGVGNSWGFGTTAADVKREVGPPLAKKSKGKSDGKGGKNKRARNTVDQDGVQLCFSWNFGGGTYGELSPGCPCAAGRIHKCTTCRADKHSARQCPQT